MEVLGIDISSSGIKGCVVETQKGKILSDAYSSAPLEDTSPHKVLSRLHQVVKKHFDWDGPVGCALPAPVRHGNVLSARHIDKAWVDVDAEQLFEEITGLPVAVINDTDATGIAEMKFGVGKHQEGLVVVLTVSEGVGSSLFIDGKLIPNTELGEVRIQNTTVAQFCSYKTIRKENLGKKDWANRLQQCMEHYEQLFHPDLFILGGELSRKAQKVFPYIKINTSFKAAGFQNEASIIGAAMIAPDKEKKVFYR